MHVCTDYDGNPLSYHVEFLGEKHTHSWVGNRSVELYGSGNCGKENQNTGCRDTRSHQGLKVL